MAFKPHFTITNVREALQSFIYNGLNGTTLVKYGDNAERAITKIPAGHIYGNLDAALSTQKDPEYPKASIAMDGGDYQRGVSAVISEQIGFTVIFIMKQTKIAPFTADATLQIENLVDDFFFILERNPSFGNVVSEAKIADWGTDSGYTGPEATAYFRLVLELRRFG